MLIVDGHVHIGNLDPVWGKAPFSADDLIALMDEPFTVFGETRRIDLAVAMPRIGLTAVYGYSFKEQHQAVIDAIEKYPDRIVGNFVLNPRLGLDSGIETLRELVTGGGFRMIKMHPTLHNYYPDDRELASPILEEAAALGIPVLIHTGEPPFAVPAFVDTLARDHPRSTIILGHYGTQWVGYAHDAINVARHNDNVLLETGFGPLPRFIEGVRAIGSGRLVFGSDSPPEEIYSQLRLVECLTRKPPLGWNLSEEEVGMILGGTLKELLKL